LGSLPCSIRAMPYRSIPQLSFSLQISSLFSSLLSTSFVSISATFLRLSWDMEDFNNSDWNWFDFSDFQPTAFVQCSEISFNHTANVTPLDDTSSGNTSDTICNTPLEGIQTPQPKRRRQTSECSQSEALVRPRKSRKLRAPHETAKLRKKGACFLCKKDKKEVNLIYQLSCLFVRLN
jgi:hypothetical protein